MKNRILIAAAMLVLLVAILILLAVAYSVGKSNGNNSAKQQQMKRDLELHRELVALDKNFLTNVVTRPNAMTSGTYTLEARFAGKTTEVSVLELEFANGQLMKPSIVPIQDIVQTGSVATWVRCDMDEGPSASFVGLIDGNEIWGRIYVEPGQGWREGESPAYGVWRLYPKPD